MGRCVLVVGTGRSGTSAIAGALAELGVHMGDEFVSRSRSNKYGTFEDKEFFDFNRNVILGTFNGSPDDWFSEYAKRRNDRARDSVWGIKDPALVHTLPKVLSLLGEDVRIIVARRGAQACVNSYLRAYGGKYLEAEEWYRETLELLNSGMSQYNGKYIIVDFDKLIAQPEELVPQISAFAFEDLEPPSWESTQRAIGHVKTKGSNFDSDGKWIKRITPPGPDWGRVAVGVRVAKHPEFGFFVSWTAMTTGGMRNGDKILVPKGHMPAHWASNAIARDYMTTDLESLLLVDDDMEFDSQDLERLRSNEANHDFDVIFGFCTQRVYPPRPVVMRVREQQPPLPLSLHGELFDTAHEIIVDNEVIEVDAVGLAFTLIKRHVIEEMTGEYGPDHTFYFSYGPGKESDDIPFSRRCRELGFKLGVDISTKIRHIGTVPFGWDEYQGWYQSLVEERRPSFDLDGAELVSILEEAMPHLDSTKESAARLMAAIESGGG